MPGRIVTGQENSQCPFLCFTTPAGVPGKTNVGVAPCIGVPCKLWHLLLNECSLKLWLDAVNFQLYAKQLGEKDKQPPQDTGKSSELPQESS